MDQAMRDGLYNAIVSKFIRVHEDLAILRVVADIGPIPYVPGQYVVLGLGDWEPRVAGVQEEMTRPNGPGRLIKRAYSISSPLLDADGNLARPGPELEFYLALVRFADREPPALSPRLFALHDGDRLFVGPRAHGTYTLAGVRPTDNVIFAATGTGEAPHNAMLVELLRREHQGRIVAVVCTRYERDLAYLEPHRRLEEKYPQYCYLPLTTREPRNTDPSRADYVGKLYLQDYFASGRFEQAAGVPLDPTRTHVFLCGNPRMIGAPTLREGQRVYPSPPGMVEVLERIGFQSQRRGQAGNLHYETYW